MEYVTSIILDTRRPKNKDLYPVKLRIYSSQLQKKKLYATKYDLTKKDFKSIWETEKPRIEYKVLRNELQAIELKADGICKALIPFSFTQFEKKYLRNNGDGNNIIYQYELIIQTLKKRNQFGTANNYKLSLQSIKQFIQYSKGKEPTKILFVEITPDWLEKYERFMTEPHKVSAAAEIKSRSLTTVSMYLRALRTVFNTAISDKEIDIDIYPFGKRKYQIPAVRNVKKALNQNQLRQLFEAKPKTPEQEKAKDFWFFSYACNGMNIKDIALLKYKDVQEDKLIFYRAKTINTSKTDLKPITVYLNDFSKSIINKYGNKDKRPLNPVFSIVSDKNNEYENFRAIKNFIISINKNLKKLAFAEGIECDISTYWARHSFSSNSIRNGATMEFISEALGHNNLKTTQGYFAGFEDKDKKEFMKKIMDF